MIGSARGKCSADKGDSYRIAVDLTPLLPGGNNGGAKILVLELLRHFQVLANDCEFILLTSDRNHEELASLQAPNVRRLLLLHGKQKGNNTINRIISARFSLRLQLRLLPFYYAWHRFAERFKPVSGLLAGQEVDLLFCPFTAPTYAEADIPLVAVVHDLQHKEFPHFFSAAEVLNRDNFFHEVVTKADCLICVSNFTRNTLQKFFLKDKERAVTIANAIHQRFTVPSQKIVEKIRGKYVLPRPYMFYPANFWPHKNHRMLLTAFAMLMDRRPECNLDMVFTGALEEEEENLKQAVLRMGLDGRVHFLGYVTEEDLAAIWQASKFLVFPSLYEGFGIPLLEAMNIGKPVACSYAASLPEVAGDAALFFDPRKPESIMKAIEQLSDDDQLAKKLVAKGKNRVRDFQPENMAETYLQVFKQVLSKKKAGRVEVEGVFSDGWTSHTLKINVPPGVARRILHLNVSLPEYVPYAGVSLKITGGRGKYRNVLQKGEDKIIAVPLPSSQTTMIMAIGKTFQPIACGLGEDSRFLGIRCNSWSVTHDSGTFRTQ